MVTANLEGLAGKGGPSKANSPCESLEPQESLALGELPVGEHSRCLRRGGNVKTEVGAVGRGQSRKGHKVRTYPQDQGRHSGC